MCQKKSNISLYNIKNYPFYNVKCNNIILHFVITNICKNRECICTLFKTFVAFSEKWFPSLRSNNISLTAPLSTYLGVYYIYSLMNNIQLFPNPRSNESSIKLNRYSALFCMFSNVCKI